MDCAVEPQAGTHSFSVTVKLGAIPAEAVRVELYAEPLDGAPSGVTPAEIHLLTPSPGPARESVSSPPSSSTAIGTYAYSVMLPATRPHTDYTPRVVPYHPAASVPLEANQILWYR